MNPVGDIKLVIDGETYVMVVFSDVTPQEVWLLVRLLDMVRNPTTFSLDIRSYLDEHGLWKFFKNEQ